MNNNKHNSSYESLPDVDLVKYKFFYRKRSNPWIAISVSEYRRRAQSASSSLSLASLGPCIRPSTKTTKKIDKALHIPSESEDRVVALKSKPEFIKTNEFCTICMEYGSECKLACKNQFLIKCSRN